MYKNVATAKKLSKATDDNQGHSGNINGDSKKSDLSEILNENTCNNLESLKILYQNKKFKTKKECVAKERARGVHY